MTDATPSGPPESTNGAVPNDGGLADLVRGAPRVDAADAIGMARVAGGVVWRAVNAVTRRGIGAAGEIVRDVRSGEPLSDIVDHQVEKARSLADFIPEVPHASSGRSGLFSHTSQPQYR